MKLRRVIRAILKTALIGGLIVAYLTAAIALAGFVTPATVTLVALSAGALMFLSALAYFAASQATWKNSVRSNEREHPA